MGSENQRAIVIGSSIAGLLTARVLSDRFASVTVIDTDKLPEKPENRRGVPQSVQPHVLFTKGYRILEELFPGIGDELSAAGALSIDWTREFHHFGKAGWNQNADVPSTIVSYTCSRPLIEWAIRRRMCSRIQFLEQHRVTGLLSEGKRVNGVRMHSLAGDGLDELTADLVVDASGRRSLAPKWLESLGLTPPPETVVNPYLGYATCRYREPEGFTGDWKVMLISQQPPDATRLGYLAKIEGGEWIATLGGYGHDFPPTDEDGFLEFARSLPNPRFYEAIKHAERVSPIYAHRATNNRLRHYEKIQVPQGFVALGDAVCALCPVYGQGMTVSALSAMLLRDWLADSQRISSRFQKSLAKSNSLHWMIATSQDSRFLTTAGRKEANGLLKVFEWYTQQLLQSTTTNADSHTLLMEIAHLLKSPLAIYHPQVVFSVLSQKKVKQ